MIADDGITGGKADTDALADRFGGEEGLEQFILDFHRDAAAVVLDHQGNAVIVFQPCSDQNATAGIGGIKGIGQQIDDHLFELGFIAEYGRQILLQFGQDREVPMFLEMMLEDEQGVGHALVEIDLAEARSGGPAEGQERLDNIPAEQAFLDDFLGRT